MFRGRPRADSRDRCGSCPLRSPVEDRGWSPATTRTSADCDVVPPTRSNSRSCSTRSRSTCVSTGSSPTSSRKSVPPAASSKRPSRRCSAPVNAPRSWPNSSEAISVCGIAAQLTLTKGAPRGPTTYGWRARELLARSVSPVTRTVDSVGATFRARASIACSALDAPTIPPVRAPISRAEARPTAPPSRSRTALEIERARCGSSTPTSARRRFLPPHKPAVSFCSPRLSPCALDVGSISSRIRAYARTDLPAVEMPSKRASNKGAGRVRLSLREANRTASHRPTRRVTLGTARARAGCGGLRALVPPFRLDPGDERLWRDEQ
jgi:hypothetical protein